MGTQHKNEYETQADAFCSKHGVAIIKNKIGLGFHFHDDTTKRMIWEITIERVGKKPFTFKFGDSIADSKFQGRQPSNYSILACLTKSDPENHADFCASYGYEEDSRRGLETYLAVKAEWANVNRIFADCMDELQEIQ